MARPATGQTAGQHFRLPQTVTVRLGEIAEAQNRSKTDVVVEALQQYFTRYDRRTSAASDRHGEEQA